VPCASVYNLTILFRLSARVQGQSPGRLIPALVSTCGAVTRDLPMQRPAL